MLDTKSLLPKRFLLSEAMLIHRQAIEEQAGAWRAADEAWALFEAAGEHLKTFDGLDQEITAFRAERVKAWSSGNRSDPTSRDLPPDLESAIGARDLAAADAASSAAVHKVLKSEAEKADATVERAGAVLGKAAQQVMIETAEEVADELARVQALADALRFRLRAFRYVVPLSKRARDLAEYPREPYLIPGNNPEQREIDNASAYHRRLLDDPDAVLDQTVC